MKEMNPAMKKTIAWILALAMLSTSAMALAENTPPQMPQGRKRTAPGNAEWQKPATRRTAAGAARRAERQADSYDAVTTVSTDTEFRRDD